MGECAGTCTATGSSAGAIPLTQLRPGQVGVVCETCLDAMDAAMLRAMGLRPAASIRLCRLGEPCIVEVFPADCPEGEPGACAQVDCRCRIGLIRYLADRVRVVPKP